MKRPDLILRFCSLTFFGFGLWALIAPQMMLGMVGISLTEPAALAEVNAYYGGLEIGFGIFLCWSTYHREYIVPAALAALSIYFGCFAGRVIGMLAHQTANWPLVASATGELAGAVASFIVYRRARVLFDQAREK